ncbi:DUF4139 domain-containing protein [bacterium]|nr:DUF4139 domain-containing protein [bacterium]
MKRTFLTAIAAAVALIVCNIASAAEVGTVDDVALTVYNQNLALVKEVRTFSFEEGLNFLTLTGVPSAIDTTSVHFKPLQGEVELLEQNYDYDLVSRNKLLQKYIGQTITVVDENGEAKQVVLLSVADGIVVDYKGKILLNPPGSLELPSLPGGLLLRPTLEWQVFSPRAFTTSGEVSYLSSGLSWSADYVAMLSDSEKLADLEGWVTMTNNSGASYENAKLKLVAGEIHRARPPMKAAGRMLEEAAMVADGAGFAEESFFEYHLYTLQRRTTIKDRQEKQISLLTGNNIPVTKIYTYDPDWRGDNVEVRIEFKNSEQNGIGIPLPAGRVRVFKRDSEGMAQLVGEDNIGHTPKDEMVRLLLGNAFDIKGEKTQTDYLDKHRGYQASYEVLLRNHKDESVFVLVPHHIGYANWKVISSSLDYTKKDATTIEFRVPVAADGEAKLTYTLDVWWR